MHPLHEAGALGPPVLRLLPREGPPLHSRVSGWAENEGDGVAVNIADRAARVHDEVLRVFDSCRVTREEREHWTPQEITRRADARVDVFFFDPRTDTRVFHFEFHEWDGALVEFKDLRRQFLNFHAHPDHPFFRYKWEGQ